MLACGCGDGAPSPSASAAPSGKTSASAAISSSPSPPDASATPSAAGSAAAASSVLTPEDFCAQAVRIGEDNLGGCAPSEKANVTSMGHVKDLATVAKECSMRVGSANVMFHGDVAHDCIQAAKARGGITSFYIFDLIPACSGVLTGKAGDGQPALYAEECAAGLAMLKNRCVKPQAANARCDDYPAGLLGKVDEHPRCEVGTLCFMTHDMFDGNQATFACLPPSDLGANCKLHVNTCPEGTSCYQGKCRAKSPAEGVCMFEADCVQGHWCQVTGGVFGKCVPKAPEVGCRKAPG